HQGTRRMVSRSVPAVQPAPARCPARARSRPHRRYSAHEAFEGTPHTHEAARDCRALAPLSLLCRAHALALLSRHAGAVGTHMVHADLGYDERIDYVFDHAVPFYEQTWYFEPDGDWWSPRPDQAIDYLTRLFENPEPLTDQFADSQIAQGLTYLVSASAGSYCRFLTDGRVPPEARVTCIAAMQTLFARIFQPR